MSDQEDPRVFFAAERTLLAWLRTAIAIVGLGFVVSRFGLFLRAIASDPLHTPTAPWSSMIGILLVLLGAVAAVGAAWQYVRFVRRLASSERPRDYSKWFAVWISMAIAVAAFSIALYLVVT